MILNKTNLNSYREFPNEVQNENEVLTDKTVEELFYNGDTNYPLFTIENSELVFNVSAEDIKAEIKAKEQEKLDTLNVEELAKAKSLALSTLTVTTSQGNTFDGNFEARLNLTNAIMASDITGNTSTPWKLADNSVVTVELSELKEALALAIQEVGRIVGATE